MNGSGRHKRTDIDDVSRSAEATDSPTDAQLIAQLRARDARALTTLFQKILRRPCAICLSTSLDQVMGHKILFKTYSSASGNIPMRSIPHAPSSSTCTLLFATMRSTNGNMSPLGYATREVHSRAGVAANPSNGRDVEP